MRLLRTLFPFLLQKPTAYFSPLLFKFVTRPRVFFVFYFFPLSIVYRQAFGAELLYKGCITYCLILIGSHSPAIASLRSGS